jgi:arsenite-transporting ATPase
MALTALTRYLQDDTYTKLVVDTAPTGHFLRLLELPEILRSWIRAIFEILLKYKKVFRAPKAQAYLVELSRAIREIQEALKDRRTSSVVPVGIPTELSLAETGDLVRSLTAMGLEATLGVLNHMVPGRSICPTCTGRWASSRTFLDRYQTLLGRVPLLTVAEQVENPTGSAVLTKLGQSLFGQGEAYAE